MVFYFNLTCNIFICFTMKGCDFLDKEYQKVFNDINKEFVKKHRFDSFWNYLKRNHLSIIAIIISIVSLFKSS